MDGEIVLPEVLGRETWGKALLGRWSQAPSSGGTGMSVGTGKVWDGSKGHVLIVYLRAGFDSPYGWPCWWRMIEGGELGLIRIRIV